MINFENLKGSDGHYPDDIADIISCADLNKKQILTKVGKMVVEHRRYREGNAWLEDILCESGTGLEATSGLLFGEPGVGKSTLLRKFVRRMGGPFETASGTKRPVVRVVTPPKPTEERLIKAMLDAFGVPELGIGKIQDMKHVVVRQIQAQGVKLIIFDEFTHIVEDRSEKFTKTAAREIKFLLSEGHCQFAFAGTPQLEKIHELYVQFKRRSGGDFELTPFDWDNEDDREEWSDILNVIHDALPIEPYDQLGDGRLPLLLHMATNGNLDNLIKLLFRATSIAYDDGDDALQMDVLAEAFERMRRGSSQDNPFGDKRKRLVKPRMIVEDDDDEITGLRNMPRQTRDSFSRSFA